MTPDYIFTMGYESVDIPPFVSRSHGSVTASYVFAFTWAVLPTIYVANFIIMITMSNRSPGKWVQRVFAIFGMIHFLFWTDIVSYKYGRGYRNDHKDAFHWTEKWSWRIGIFIPLYQNCTNGHWGRNGHRYYPMVGVAHRYGVIVWGVLFFIFQTIQADMVKTYEFVMDLDSEGGLIKSWGYGRNTFLKPLIYPYFSALVWMWMMYFLLHVTGFKLYRINMRRACVDGTSPAEREEIEKLIGKEEVELV